MRQLVGVTLALALAACGKDSTGNTDASNGSNTGSDDGGQTTIDAAPPDGSTAGVTCGTGSAATTCSAGMECCTTFTNNMASNDCVAAGTQCQGFSKACDGPEDCMTNERCCASFGGGGGGGITCQGTGGQCGRELCHTPADCSTAGSMCCTSQFLGYSYCAATCP
jgi:hypothetical protein